MPALPLCVELVLLLLLRDCRCFTGNGRSVGVPIVDTWYRTLGRTWLRAATHGTGTTPSRLTCCRA